MGFGEGHGTSGEVWSTYTDLGDFMRFGIVFAANVSRPFNITPTNVGFSPMILQVPTSPCGRASLQYISQFRW